MHDAFVERPMPSADYADDIAERLAAVQVPEDGSAKRYWMRVYHKAVKIHREREGAKQNRALVRALDWSLNSGFGVHGAHIADAVHRYIIYPKDAGQYFSLYRGTSEKGKFKSLDAAKLAAQRDLEKVVLGALQETKG